MIKKLYRFLSPKFQTLFLEYHTNMIPRYGHGKLPHKDLYGIINSHRAEYEHTLNESIHFFPQLQKIRRKESKSVSDKIVWNNGYLPGMDIAMIYTLLAIKNPGKYIEVGSGYSTLTAHKAIGEQNLDTEIISIDPQPRAEVDKKADKVIRQ